jgi:Fic-DOC domain mobile mystery protein B
MRLELPPIDGATPLRPDDIAGLRLDYIRTQADLNEAEEANILRARRWLRRNRSRYLLHREFVLLLHRRMFGDVWRWAGTWRLRDTNIGVDPAIVAVRVEQVLNDVLYWVHNSTFPVDEIAVRLHHQLVSIHPFANGNGRHTRLLSDLVAVQLGGTPFSWGGHNLNTASDLRARYIGALQSADRGHLAPLITFARS